MRLIDADALKEAMSYNGGCGICFRYVDDADTIDAEPVVHGRWDRKSCVNGKQYDPTTDYWAYAHRCSECDKVSYFPNNIPDKWCRRCGAKMDGDGNAR